MGGPEHRSKLALLRVLWNQGRHYDLAGSLISKHALTQLLTPQGQSP